ncbi:MAG TPA: RsmE family RNA methyltransferase [Thermoanaerobaculia bacterium]|jgi:16S rRNA (uracil1498-N3)-methyltransferase
MRHRIYVDTITEHVTVKDDEFHHAIRVVRARTGEPVELFDRSGKLAAGVVESIERDQAVIRVERELPSRETAHPLHLAMAIIQLEKFELVLQKATELGVHSFLPLVTERVELRPERYSGKMDRWQKIVFEAVKQSGRSVIPRIEAPLDFEDALKREGKKIFFDADAPADALGTVEDATLFIGPEGGWTDEELALARDAHCLFQRLGARRLRAETAAIAAVAIITARTGDL